MAASLGLRTEGRVLSALTVPTVPALGHWEALVRPLAAVHWRGAALSGVALLSVDLAARASEQEEQRQMAPMFLEQRVAALWGLECSRLLGHSVAALLRGLSWSRLLVECSRHLLVLLHVVGCPRYFLVLLAHPRQP